MPSNRGTLGIRYLEDGIRAWREKKFEDAAFAECPAGHIRPEAVPVEKVGHFMSMVFKAGTRTFMFRGTQNRDRFLNLYRNNGARPVGKDPCP